MQIPDKSSLLTILDTVDPAFPARLKDFGYPEGDVTFAVVVDQNGKLQDSFLIEASHLEFAEEVSKVLPLWSFTPPIIDGEPSSIASKIKVIFERGRGFLYESGGSNSLGNRIGKRSGSESYQIYPLKELDSIPIPRKIVEPSFHSQLLEGKEVVTAVFEFYIDEAGRVRIPTLRESAEEIDETLLVLAQEALLQWEFEPPLKNGKPVATLAAQPFRFAREQAEGAAD